MKAQDATPIVAAMAAAYIHATSYVDKGRVRKTFIQGQDRRLVVKPFTTAFVRSDKFRFEFRTDNDDPKQAYVIWSDGVRTVTRWYIRPGLEVKRDLDHAVAGATGVSSGSAHTVPRLLLPDVVSGFALTELTDLRLAGSEALDGHMCWKIIGRHPDAKTDTTLWIDQRSHLLRRMFGRHHFSPATTPMGTTSGEFDTETTTDFDPIANEPVDPEQLRAPQ